MDEHLYNHFEAHDMGDMLFVHRYIIHLGPVPRKMVKFNPGLSEILSTVFLLRECNSSLQNTVELLLCDTVMIYTKCFSKQCIGR